MDINTNAIEQLTTVNRKDDLSKYDNLPPDIYTALQVKLDRRKHKAAEDAAEEIVKLIDLAENVIDQNVKKVREIRRSEKSLLRGIQQIDLARAYGLDTNNFLPLLAALGFEVPVTEGSDQVVTVADIPEKEKKKLEKKLKQD